MVYLIGINIISLLIYGIDKWNSIRKRERIPEKILLLLASIGGCYGSLLGMILFHHKIRKRKFQVIIPVTVLLWSILLYKGVI